MKRILLAAGLAAAAGAMFTGTAHADDPVIVCESKPPVYTGCTYVHTNHVCVTGGGTILGDPYRIAPC